MADGVSMRPALFALVMILLVAACGTARVDMKWTKPAERTDDQYARDRQDCWEKSGPGGFVGAFTSSSDKFELCMEAKGYRRVK